MTMLTHLPGRAVLSVTGEDRVGYLQGLVSNDVAAAAPGRAVWAALLTPQGKWLADFFIVADGDALLLDTEAAQADDLARRLTRFRLRARIMVERSGHQVYAGWDGPAPTGAFADPRLADAGWRVLTATPLTANATPDDYDRHRLALGLPDGSRDMEAEKSTLLEAGFDELQGVSWTKGCYMGQELTARTKYRGLVKRRLVPVTAAAALPPPGTPVTAAGAEIGTLRSAHGANGLALLRTGSWADGLECGGLAVTVHPPAWMRLGTE